MSHSQGSLTLTHDSHDQLNSTVKTKIRHYSDSSYSQDASGLELFSESFPGLLRDRAATTPNALAVDSYTCQWTYAQLERNVLAAERLFKDRGISSGQKVGLCFHLSPWAVVSILAVMNLGGAVVPVDPLHPPARRRTMLLEAGVDSIIVEESSSFHDLLDSGFSLVDVSVIASIHNIANSTIAIDGGGPSPESDAFVAFTSGSTGKPKGIVQTHEAIVTMSKALAKKLHVDDSSRVAQFHPYIFDVAMMEIGMCLATGACLCISKRKDMMLPSPGEIGEQLTKSRITHVTLTPTMLNTIDPEHVPSVKVVSAMGEPLGLHTVQNWGSNNKRTFYQLWGCTEATILQSITAPITPSHAPQNVGAPIQGACRLWIVDPTDVNTLIPDGEAGELVVESRALAKGCINQPEETARVFIKSATWMDPSSQGTLYKTNDLAQKNADGTITFLGRLDNQMNYYGDRIELGEIDYHIGQAQSRGKIECFSDFHAPSKTVVGFVCGSSRAENHLRESSPLLSWDASVTTKSTMQQITEELTRNGELPEYMVPHFWVPIKQRPLTISGKTDRACLRQTMESLTPEEWEGYCVSCSTS